MILYGLIYVSEKSYQLTLSQYLELVEKASVKNDHYHLTGFLCELEDNYLQYLEGKKENLEKVFSIISEDDRHHNISVYWFPIEQRKCAAWSMLALPTEMIGAVHFGHLVKSVLKLLDRPAFDQFEVERMIRNLLEKWIQVNQNRGSLR